MAVPIVVVSLLTPLAYVLGTFPSAHLVARRHGVDVTAAGSGNPGASNVGRLLGRRAGVGVFVLDALKGALPALVGLAVNGTGAGLVLGGAALAGHVFPATRGWRGGKGVATAGGVCVALYPVLGLVAMAAWLVLAKATRRASLASLVATLTVPVGLVVTGRPWGELVGVAAMAGLIVVRHRANLRRLVRGDESTLTSATPRRRSGR
jgi:glycerol-3-phosphate acyltransferase PlsY